MKKLAIIGASYLQLPLVCKANAMGIETHCFAWEEGAVCREFSDYFYPISILDKEAIFVKCSELDIDGITTIATDMAVPTICYVAERMGLIGNSYVSSLFSTNKGLMRNRFKEFKVQSPNFIEVDSFMKEILNDFHFPLIVKPIDRSGSRGVNKVNNEIELKESINIACEESLTGRCIIEEFISGVEVSVESITWNGQHHIVAVTDKVTTGSPFFVELAHHQPSLLSFELLEKIKSETFKALNSLQIKYGAGHSEFKITDTGEVYIIEVGARMGGDFIGSHLVELSTGYDFVKEIINVALNNFESPELPSSVFSSGIFFLSKETEALLPFFSSDNDFDIEKKILDPNLKVINNSNDRSGYLIYKSDKRVSLL